MDYAIEPLRDLGGLRAGGLNKHWPYDSSRLYALNQDYLEKINYSVGDFNSIIKGWTAIELDSLVLRKDVVFMVVTVDWILEAAEKIWRECCRKDVTANFQFEDEERLQRYKEYFRAVRSFVVAHPVNTNRHSKQGLDGDLICADITSRNNYLKFLDPIFQRLSPSSQENSRGAKDTEIVLKTYSIGSDPRFSHFTTFDMRDVRNTAELYIDKVYALDRYLSGLKRRDYPQ